MYPAHVFFVKPKLPKKLQPLQHLASNLYWHREAETVALFKRLQPMVWEEVDHNPVMMLRSVQEEDLITAANDSDFISHLNVIWHEYQNYQKKPLSWGKRPIIDPEALVAFFSAEFGFRESLPIYAGGLGLLAGDYLKSISDLGFPMVGIGLLYREGYFRQHVDIYGRQHEHYNYSDFDNFALEMVCKPDGRPLTVKVDFPDRYVNVQVWKGFVGRIQLYLLDTDCQNDFEEDRRITDRLYGGDIEKRIQQELVLGIGGMRALEALGIKPTVCHMNEGHSAFLALERIRRLIVEQKLGFEEARELAASGNLFTTHTPVKAGIDIFPLYLIDKYFTGYYQSLNLSRQEFLALARLDSNNSQEPFNMAVLALNLADWANGVSRLHGRVARNMWKYVWPQLPEAELPIGSVTNGVHATTWVGTKLAALYDHYLGDWRSHPQDEANWTKIDNISDKELWQIHMEQKQDLLAFTRSRIVAQMKQNGCMASEISAVAGYLNPEFLTIGFARRFAPYKRPTLLLRDRERLIRILTNAEHPVQMIFAGKAHPHDEPGKTLIQEVVTFARKNNLQSQFIFLEDYDINIARHLVQGVDVWLGNPRRPMEASSTSGMKAALNGVIQLSILDGWWDEAWTPETGWAIGNGEVYDNVDYQDDVEAMSLYRLLEEEVIPLYYERDNKGIPRDWVLKMKNSIQAFGPAYNTHRMAEEYAAKYYCPAANHYQRLSATDHAKAKELLLWKNKIRTEWKNVRIESVSSKGEEPELEVGKNIMIEALINFGTLAPEEVRVEILYGYVNNNNEIVNGEPTVLASYQKHDEGKYLYQGTIACSFSGRQGFNIRVYPYHEELAYPFQLGLLLWA